jgi:hypothetical protein
MDWCRAHIRSGMPAATFRPEPTLYQAVRRDLFAPRLGPWGTRILGPESRKDFLIYSMNGPIPTGSTPSACPFRLSRVVDILSTRGWYRVRFPAPLKCCINRVQPVPRTSDMILLFSCPRRNPAQRQAASGLKLDYSFHRIRSRCATSRRCSSPEAYGLRRLQRVRVALAPVTQASSRPIARGRVPIKLGIRGHYPAESKSSVKRSGCWRVCC